MNYSIANGQQKRTLSVNDLAGGNAVMARNLSGGVCAIGTMTALTVSNCALPREAFQQQILQLTELQFVLHKQLHLQI